MFDFDKEIYLHIGTPKTGTSALQKFLVENRFELERRGFSYPKHSLGEYGISSGNGQEIVNIGLEYGAEKARDYLSSLVKKAKSKKVLISSEAFYACPELMYEVVPNATVIVYFRNQIDLLESSYNQAVKREGQKAPFSRALRRVIFDKDSFYTGELVLKWVELFGLKNVIFRVYEEGFFKNENIYDDFLDAIGIESSKEFKKPGDKVNVSYCLDALEYKRCLNAVVEGVEFPYMKDVDAVLQNYSHDYFKAGGRKYSLYSKEELDEADRFFQPYRELLAKTFGLRSRLFNKSYKLKPFSLNSEARIIAIRKITDQLLHREPRIEKVLATCLAAGLKADSGAVRSAAIKLSPLLARPSFYEASYKELASDEDKPLWFTERQLSMMTDSRYREPDFLRDIAVLANNRKQTSFAYRLIKRALELRPNGPKIIELERDYRTKLREL